MPTPSLSSGVALVLLTALPVLLAARAVLVRLPEPDEPEGKVAYATLPTRRFVGVCTLLAAAASGLVALTLPPATWPLWWVLGAPALVLVAVDARTTWLPLGLTRAVQAAAAGALVLSVVLGGTGLLVRSAVGAAAAALLYLGLWRVARGGLGFGDVRLAPVLGASAAAVGWSTLLATLLLGSLVGAAVGAVRALRRRPGSFAYAPSMLTGAFLASAVRLLTS